MPIDYQQLAEQLEEVAAGRSSDLMNDEPARRRLLVAMQKALPEIESFQDTCQRLMYTPLELAVAQIGCNLKIFETLAAAKAPATTEQLAKPFGANAHMLDRILKYMASLSMVKEVGKSTWEASRTTRTLAQPTVAGGIYHNFDTVGPAVMASPKWLKDNEYQAPLNMSKSPFKTAHSGQDIMQFIIQHPENLEKAELFMTIHRFSEGTWINAFPDQEITAAATANSTRTLFVDVAGGLGHQCRALLAKHPEWAGRVVLQELAQVVEKTPSIPGVEIKAIDIFKEPPVKGAAAYYLRSVLHDWPDDQCLTIFSHLKESMAPDSLLLIDEMVLPAQDAQKISMQSDLIMLLCLGASERSEQHWHELLQKAGFKIDRIHKYHPQDDEGLIVAKLA